ncbi:sialidase [Candidatus Falkowbacteria bacterium]|nr:sialidase [Candidatus Falkowbacteria bacterium]
MRCRGAAGRAARGRGRGQPCRRPPRRRTPAGRGRRQRVAGRLGRGLCRVLAGRGTAARCGGDGGDPDHA